MCLIKQALRRRVIRINVFPVRFTVFAGNFLQMFAETPSVYRLYNCIECACTINENFLHILYSFLYTIQCREFIEYIVIPAIITKKIVEITNGFRIQFENSFTMLGHLWAEGATINTQWYGLQNELHKKIRKKHLFTQFSRPHFFSTNFYLGIFLQATRQ